MKKIDKVIEIVQREMSNMPENFSESQMQAVDIALDMVKAQYSKLDKSAEPENSEAVMRNPDEAEMIIQQQTQTINRLNNCILSMLFDKYNV